MVFENRQEGILLRVRLTPNSSSCKKSDVFVDSSGCEFLKINVISVPEKGKANFTLPEGKMEIGMGIHGEPGIKLEDLSKADDIVEQMMKPLLEDLPYVKGDEVSVLVNGLGATPREELYIVYRKVAQILENHGIKIFNNYIGEYATSMDMAGMSVSLFKLDDELKKYLKAPFKTPMIMQPQL